MCERNNYASTVCIFVCSSSPESNSSSTCNSIRVKHRVPYELNIGLQVLVGVRGIRDRDMKEAKSSNVMESIGCCGLPCPLTSLVVTSPLAANNEFNTAVLPDSVSMHHNVELGSAS